MLSAQGMQAGFRQRYANRIVTVDSHTEGEPTRLLVGGVGNLPGTTIKAKKAYFETHFDAVRRLLTREPRGHRGIMAAVLTEPVSPGAAFGLFFMDARRYPFLCGHATIGAVATLIEIGAVTAVDGATRVRVDTPSGPMDAHARIDRGRVVSVAIDMVPSFVFDTGRTLTIPGSGTLSVDLVCVGGFFVMVAARDLGIALVPANSRRLIRLGMTLIEAANRAFDVYHPLRSEVRSVDVTEFHDWDAEAGIGKSAVVYGESHLDRSPCGTGTTAKMTLLHHQKKLAPGQVYRNSSPLGTVFEGRILASVPVGEFDGVVCQIRGSAQITGYHQFVVDEADPFQEGFLL